MNLKTAIIMGLISASSICQADNQEHYAINKEYAEYEDGTEILINKDSLTTVKASLNNDEVAEIFISPKDENHISHNKYDRFRVDDGGIILNNTQVKADYIINEVINNGPTSLIEGNIGIKGQAAHVIIANPNGITCDNCSFSNTLSETLVSGSVQRLNNTVAIYNATELPDISSSDHSKFIPNRGKINIINSKSIDNNTIYNQLNIISHGITINNKISSSNNINFFNNYNVIHNLDSTMNLYYPMAKFNSPSVLNPLSRANRPVKNLPKRPNNNYLIIGNKETTNAIPSNLSGSIYSDNEITIYANQSQVKNHGYLNSRITNLSLYNRSKLENHNSIFTENLILNKERTSTIINMESGYIFHYLPHIYNSTSSMEEINDNEINNNEKNRVITSLNHHSFNNRGVFQFLTLKHTH
ncbi:MULTISPECIES: filamentous hemagglutinin N-terminal domain-containing protein [Gammaproteobacteria]|uniref:two-partner secretion domain-containing protein n=1 Tax=Gammaproteobacteria TaxID=1236 RepID=UPI001865F172|nr:MULTISPECIES: filamentous hemagglutinin N-terminal domain-containing protein [Gammaproteobacteria]